MRYPNWILVFLRHFLEFVLPDEFFYRVSIKFKDIIHNTYASHLRLLKKANFSSKIIFGSFFVQCVRVKEIVEVESRRVIL